MIYRCFFWLACYFSLNVAAFCNPIVQINSSLGDFKIELFDEVAPVTVNNFLNYVESDRYNGTLIHRSVPYFVIQGGWLSFQSEINALVSIKTDDPIINEFRMSNIRGTVSMAKQGGNPNSATSQWFVNLIDNTSLDTTNGGFTVFGNVLGEGMITVDAIAALPTVNLGGKASNAPFFTDLYSSPLDFVYINAEVVNRFSSAPHVLETATGLMITSVNIDNGEDVISLNLNSVETSPNIVMQANLESVIPRIADLDGIASYSTTDQRLRIPSLEVNDRGNIFVVTNVVFALTNSNPVQFTLESYDQ